MWSGCFEGLLRGLGGAKTFSVIDRGWQLSCGVEELVAE